MVSRLALALVVCVFAPPLRAQTFTDAVLGYAWASDGAVANYSVPEAWSYTVSGGAVTASRSAIGTYSVEFAGLAAPLAGSGIGGHVQVTAYGTGAYCSTTGWGPTSSGAVSIRAECRDAAGALVDSPYTVLLVSAAAVPGMAYAWANDATAASYTPSSTYRFNNGNAVTATRSDVGRYTMTFAGIATTSGDVQVTAYTPGTRCFARERTASGAGLTLHVRCYDHTGSFADARYTLLRLGPDSISDDVGYALASSREEASYTPDGNSSANGTRAAITATRSGPGVYQMRFARLGSAAGGGHVQVTSSNTADHYCSTYPWSSIGEDLFVDVRCFDRSGALADADYSVLAVWPLRVGVASETGAPGGVPFALAVAPNPAAGATEVSFELDRPSHVRLAVYDALGRQVAVLVDGTRGAGPHSAAFVGAGLPSGTYVARLDAEGRTATRALTLIR